MSLVGVTQTATRRRQASSGTKRGSWSPLIWQNRRSPQLVSMANPDDPNVFNDKQLLWGVDGRGAAGYALWFLMARAIA